MTEQVIEILSYALIIGAVSGFMYLMNKMASKPIEVDKDGQFHLKLPLFYAVIGVVGLLFGLFWIVLPFILSYTGEEVDTFMIILFLLCTLIFLGCGIPLLLYYKNHRVVFDQKKIIATNLYGKTTEVEWEFIDEIKFSAFSGMITVKSYDKKAKLHQHLVDLISFIEEMEAQTKYTAQDLKIPIRTTVKAIKARR